MNNAVQKYLPEIKKLLLHYGVQRAYAFGSAVKNTMHADSDVDFIISFPKDMDYETYGNNYFSLLHSLRALLKKEVDLVAEETLSNPYLIESINQNKVQIL
jgi:predicted nucleotidyltransferase